MRGFSSGAPVCVPLLFVIVACVGSLELGSDEQAATVPLQSHNFGDVQVGLTSASHTFTISPASGLQNSIVSSVTESCADFAVMATGLPAPVSNVCTTGAGSGCTSYEATTYSFTAVFTPAVAQQSSCVVTVTIDEVATTVTLTGRGTEPVTRLEVSPSEDLDFGQVRVGETSSAASVLLTNFGSGPQPLTVSSVAFDAMSLARGFAIASGTTGSHVVAPAGGRDPFTVTCRPTAVGPITGTLTITSDDSTSPVIAVGVRCTGIDSDLAFLPSSPASLNGTQVQRATRVGEPSDVVITLKNVGTAPMTLDDLALSGTDLDFIERPAPGTVLAANQETEVTVRFAATTPIGQGTLGALTVTHDGSQSRSINILGAALATSMSLSPDGLVDLGPVCLANTTSQPFFAIKNAPGSFLITSIDEPAAPFVLSGNLPTEGPLEVDNNAVSFTASVSPAEPGPLQTTFAVGTDIPGAAPRVIALTAIGLPAGVSPTPATVDLGSISVGASSTGQMVTLTNCNAIDLTLIETRLAGDNADDFALVGQPTVTTVPAGTSVSFVVVAQPNSAGRLNATLEIVYDSGTAEVALVGTGTGFIGGDDRDAEPSTYYSCSTGGTGSRAWPIVTALALLGLRRRRGARR